MTLPDNRLRFDTSLINFTTDVGLTGQDHDNFPGPDMQPRYDWLRMWYISLLANQSSHSEPTQYREGTLWFDLDTLSLKIRSNNEWRNISSSIALTDGSTTEEIKSLEEWHAEVSAQLISSAPEAMFCGRSELDNQIIIPIPSKIQPSVDMINSQPILYINGLLVDPRNVRYQTEVSIELLHGVKINKNDKFVIMIKNIAQHLVYTPDVVLG